MDIYPILQDPHPVKIDDKIYTLEYSKDDLISLLNRSSEFIDKKYKLLNYVINTKILSEEINYFEKINEKLEISLKRDPELNEKKCLKK